MIFYKASRVKLLYKKLLQIQENVQNREKLFHFKRKKWIKFQKLEHFKNLKEYKLKDQTQYIVSRYPNRRFSYSRRHKNMLIVDKKFKLFYGILLKRFIKTRIKIILYKNFKNLVLQFLKFFEHRLDVVLYRSHFTFSIKTARQLIVHRKVFVNKTLIKTSSYLLKAGDLITVDSKSFDYIRLNIRKSRIWPIPNKHLIINYKILQICFGGFINTNLSLNFLHHLHLKKVITNYY